jgi:hypothetical protein
MKVKITKNMCNIQKIGRLKSVKVYDGCIKIKDKDFLILFYQGGQRSAIHTHTHTHTHIYTYTQSMDRCARRTKM